MKGLRCFEHLVDVHNPQLLIHIIFDLAVLFNLHFIPNQLFEGI